MSRRRRGSQVARRSSRRVFDPPVINPKIGRQLIGVSIELLDKVYVHLPLKRAMYAVNPLQRLRLLQRQLSEKARTTEREFYNEMLSIFSQLRDLHTQFVLPEPFRSATACLPFTLEVCRENGERKYIVSAVDRHAPKQGRFRRGVEVTHWNGVQIDRAVAANAEREPGSNPAARHARGLEAMTMRWLGQSLAPDEEWVDVTFRTSAHGRPSVHRFTWDLFAQNADEEHEIARASAKSARLGMDARAEVERQVRSILFGPPAGASTGPGIVSTLDDVFPIVRNVKTAYGRYGYLRLATFNVEDAERLVREFIRLIDQLSPDGLILDVRGNGGGLIDAAERLLQLLTPKRVEPCRFHFVNSTRTEEVCRRREYREWHRSVAQAVETGADYSQGLPLLPLDAYNDIGQKYQGPVVLITDARCYSATDIFAAGFQDNEIGTILGVDDRTGAGGANVWEYSLITNSLRGGRMLPRRLPGQAHFRIAVRRVTRVGRSNGLPVEDLGVVPDEIHEFTRNDILRSNTDLIDHAGRILKGMDCHRLTATLHWPTSVEVSCLNVDRVDAYLDERPLSSQRVRRNRAMVPVTPSNRRLRELRLEGIRRGKLVAAARVELWPKSGPAALLRQ